MALDTQEKRMNVAGVGRVWMRSKFPTVDKDEQWRVASGLGYGGNDIAEPTTPPAIDSLVNFTADIILDLNNTGDIEI